MKVQAIIPAAGLGIRLKQNTPKSLVSFQSKPILIHTLLVFEKSSLIESVVVVVPPDSEDVFEKCIEENGLKKIKKVVPGGANRCESVRQGLLATDADTEIVVVHDAARPLVSEDVIKKAVEECQTSDAVVVAVPVTSTIKRADSGHGIISETLNRSELWEVQTPQVFKKEIFVRAYRERNEGDEPTDDASLVEALGVPVKIVEGNYRNIKITTEEDLRVAEVLL